MKNITSLYENEKNIMGTKKKKNITSLYENEKNIMGTDAHLLTKTRGSPNP
jgi:hypothetical protein